MRLLRFAILILLIFLVGSLIALIIFMAPRPIPGIIALPLPTQMVAAAPPTPAIAETAASLPPTFTPNAQLSEESTGTEHSSFPSAPPAILIQEVASPSPVPVLTSTDVSPSALISSTVEPADSTPKLAPSVAVSGELCLDSVPAKPNYLRYFLPQDVWPSPNLDVPSPHFWLSKPFLIEGGFPVNESYPYGNDLNGRLLLHNGVDATEPGDTPLLAAADGTVVVAQDDLTERFGWRCNWYGNLIVLQLDQTWMGQPVYVLYGHVLEMEVEASAQVERGERLALIGSGGAATVPHLHFEVRVGVNEFGATRNPLLWVDPAPRGVIAGRLLDPSGRPWNGVGLSLIGHFEGASGGNTWSYMSDPLEIVPINSDAGLAENFVFGGVEPGNYDIYTRIQGVEYWASVTVRSGQLSTVEIVTEAFKTPTPAP